ncbi:hypothetical protein KDK_73710 [Dictyobacter kobayashii]|uniref:Uncharacterized protein n=1 Tax=Dictyobacter kobayashii TaxID=2014872 RepID=A0A402AWQ4_9CHLR|nr:hypothetical protein KDK_73710 [Dictyobacter kobayashii]
MQPQQKVFPGSYYANLIGCILVCVLTFALIFIEIIDIFHPIDMAPINAAIHFVRLIIMILLFISSCVLHQLRNVTSHETGFDSLSSFR